MKRLTISSLLLAFTLAGGIGCSSSPEKKDEDPVEQTQSDDALDLDAPSPEELADSPCGNPDWSTLPSSMKKNEAPKSP